MAIEGKRVAVLVEKFYEDLELWYPVLRLREAGCTVTIVGPKAGETYASKHGYPAKAEASASDVKAADFDAIIIPGGYSPDHMRRHKAMVDLVKELVPNAGRVGVLLNAGSDAAVSSLQDIRQSGDRLGLQIEPLEVRATSAAGAAATDIPSAFDTAAASGADAVIVKIVPEYPHRAIDDQFKERQPQTAREQEPR